MSTRSYLSIGDVLTLLRQEFPDVTISKIRFLESQGLVNPERTPSGYRKFYEHDVERLRWVLRQQREHFLPLKVIKDRLDEDANGTEPTADAVRTSKRAAAPGAPSTPDAPATSATASDVTVEVGAAMVADTTASPSTGASVTQELAPVPAAIEPVLVGRGASSTHRSAGSGPVSSEPAPRAQGSDAGVVRPAVATATVATPPVARAHRASLAAPPHRAADVAANGSGHGSGAAAVSSAATPAEAGPTPRRARGSGSAPASDPTPAPTPASDPAPAPTPAPDPAPDLGAGTKPELELEPMLGTRPDDGRGPGGSPGARGVPSLTLDELCSASGLSIATVGQLQEYGLVRAAVIGGAEYFDEEALTVANVAAKFSAFGIEARHLRLYKNAADREAGFIEQVVIPMVRQRNPEARARAGRTAEELAGLGRQLKGSLLRTALGDLLDG